MATSRKDVEMETVNEKSIRYGRIVKEILAEFGSVPYLESGIRDRTLFDEQNHRYAVISEGWDRDERVNDIVADIEIINGKVKKGSSSKRGKK